mmetsp:Transcript_40750/g.118022  ORF Transcript_40750/g.118022 Transcript_40750/m.118022 type:complete len:258 (+) Transcript_40750:94-867(+)
MPQLRAPLAAALAALASLQGALAVRQSQLITDAGRAAATAAGGIEVGLADQRSFAAAGAGGEAPGDASPALFADPTVDTEKLAADMAAQVRAHGSAQVNTVGMSPMLAMKAVYLANKAMSGELKGKVLAVTPSRSRVPNKDGKKRNGLVLEVRAVPKVNIPKAPEVTVAASTDVGKLASHVARKFQENKKSKSVTLGGIGPLAVMNALKSAGLASRYLANDLKVDEVKLAVVPTIGEMDGKNGHKVEFMLLTCIRAP